MVIFWLNLLVISSALRGFSSSTQFFPSHKKNNNNNRIQFDLLCFGSICGHLTLNRVIDCAQQNPLRLK